MTVFIDFSKSTNGVNSPEYLADDGIVNGFTVDDISFRSAPFTIRYLEVTVQESKKTTFVASYDITAHADTYLGPDSPSARPSTTLLPVYSPEADDVFYIHGSFSEAPKIEDYVRTSIYSDSQSPGANFNIALADYQEFYDAQQQWLQAALNSPVTKLEYRDDYDSTGIHADITYSEDLTVEDLRDWIRDNTLTFELGGNTLFSEPLEITGTEFIDTLQGGHVDDVIKAGDGDDEVLLSKGADMLVGGMGLDLLNASDATSGIMVNISDVEFDFAGLSSIAPSEPEPLAANSYKYDGLEGEITEFERLIASPFDDVLVGNFFTPEMDGLAGNDTMVSGNSLTTTTLNGGLGQDVLLAGTNADLLNGGSDADVLYSWDLTNQTSTNKDTLDGGEGLDTYYVDGFADNIAATGKSTDFVTNWEVGEKIIWRGDAEPDLRSTVFINGEQHMLMRDENNDVVGGFSWGNGLGTSGNREIIATKTSINNETAIEFVVKEHTPTAIDTIRDFVIENRTAICTGRSLLDALKSILELRAQVVKVAKTGLAKSLDPSDLGEGGFAKFAQGWWPGVDEDLAGGAMGARTVSIIDGYLEDAETKLMSELDRIVKAYLTAEGLGKTGAEKILNDMLDEFCPELPEESWFVKAGELALSPLPVASAVLGIGKSVINAVYTYSVAEMDRIQREDFENLDSGIKVIFDKNGLQGVERTNGDQNDVETNEDPESIFLNDGDIEIKGPAENYRADTIFNFSEGDTISLTQSNFSRGEVKITFGSAILDIDTNRDGTADTQITLKGDFSGGAFRVLSDGTDTDITFERFAPTQVDRANAPTDMTAIRDFDGNDLGAGADWKYIGAADVQFDGDAEFIYINQTNGRWATVGPDANGTVDFSSHGQGGETRVVGIYIDPEVQLDQSKKFGPFDSQQRFQNDLAINNLTVIDAFDFDGDGFQEVYFKVNDGTAYLRALMHADGNIQYANYQSEDQVKTYLTDMGYDQGVLDAILV